MKTTLRRRALPVYIAALTFAVYSLIFPLYTLLHYFLAALVTAAIWLLADRLIKPVAVPMPEPAPEPAPQTEAESVLSEAATARQELMRLAASIADPAVTGKIESLAALSDKIAQNALTDPADIPQIQKFQGYFLPSTIALLHSYDRMSGTGGDTAARTKDRIVQMLDTEIAAFEKQLDRLFDNDALDIDADIRVMQNLLEREGLLPQDELHRILDSMKRSDPDGCV